MSKEKTTGLYFKMSPEELEMINRRMEQTGIKNKSAFIRKMCIDGHVILFDSKLLNEIGRLLRITANNVNQIARKVNSGGDATRDDIENTNSQLGEIRSCFGSLLSILSCVAGAKPGKLFIPPLTEKDLPEIAEAENTSGES
jgi:hypothetical protein